MAVPCRPRDIVLKISILAGAGSNVDRNSKVPEVKSAGHFAIASWAPLSSLFIVDISRD
jgi:hypothetical protein